MVKYGQGGATSKLRQNKRTKGITMENALELWADTLAYPEVMLAAGETPQVSLFTIVNLEADRGVEFAVYPNGVYIGAKNIELA